MYFSTNTILIQYNIIKTLLFRHIYLSFDFDVLHNFAPNSECKKLWNLSQFSSKCQIKKQSVSFTCVLLSIRSNALSLWASLTDSQELIIHSLTNFFKLFITSSRSRFKKVQILSFDMFFFKVKIYLGGSNNQKKIVINDLIWSPAIYRVLPWK